MRKAIMIALMSLGLSGLFPNTTQASQSRIESQRPVRVDAVDGDSIRRNGVLLRIVGMDAPELRARCTQERVLAERARDRMAQLGRAGVTIELVPHRDKYGRPLVIVRDRQGRNVAEILISEGLARPYDGRSARQSWCPA